MPTFDEYEAAFEVERERSYPEIDRFEARMGHAVDRDRLEEAARVLACPVKANPPNWQHGRVIFAALSHYLERHTDGTTCVDIGTAKGFSALCMAWAILDTNSHAVVHSCDVIYPDERVSRNTVAEVDGLKTLYEIIAPWPERNLINFVRMKGTELLSSLQGKRLGFVFVDGKHQYPEVTAEAREIKRSQMEGDVILFDDYHIPGVARAVAELEGYGIEIITALPQRQYALAVRL